MIIHIQSNDSKLLVSSGTALGGSDIPMLCFSLCQRVTVLQEEL